MFEKIKKWFSRSEEEEEMILPSDERATFQLKFESILVGTLSCASGFWQFEYSPDFKARIDDYKPIIGFPDLHKVYKSKELWPFFRLRIPGLKQPRIKEILKKENIDIKNEVALLKRFGKTTISNPYSLHYIEGVPDLVHG